tara:strand:+ start:83 stop:220 length:138 start_codon:yes stop_codon:yes gene_type:complete
MKNSYKYILILLVLIMAVFLIPEKVISQSIIEAKPSSNEYFPTNI